MKMRKLAGFAVLTGVLLSAGHVRCDEPEAEPSPYRSWREARAEVVRQKSLQKSLSQAGAAKLDFDKMGDFMAKESIAQENVVEIMQKGVHSSDFTKDVITLQSSFLLAAQNQRIIEQNDRTIALLEEANKKQN